MNLMAASGNSGSISMFPFMRSMVIEKGLLSLYTGLNAGLLRQIVYTTSRLGLFEVLRDEMAKYRPTDIWSRLSTGMVAGGIAAYISSPVEVTLVRISNDNTLPLEKRRLYTGLTNAFTRIFKEEGLKTFFNGSGALVQRAMVVGAVQVGTYDQFRATFRTWGVTDHFTNVFYASMASGLIFSVMTMPLETAKNQMAFQRPDSVTGVLPYRSTMQALQLIASKDGVVNGLYRGFAPYYLRCGGQTLLMFMSVEWLRKTYASLVK